MRVNNHNRLHAWMGNNAIIGNLTLDQLVLPGSHDSGSHQNRPAHQQVQLRQEITQDVSPMDQVRAGIRVLDLRVQFCPAYKTGDPRRFQLFHLNTTGQSLEDDLITPLLEYYDEPDTQREMIILDFHELKDFTPALDQEFQAMLIERLGSRCLTYDLLHKSLIYLWRDHPGRTLVLSYQGRPHHPQFCDPVNQCWIGSNTPTAATLKTFMDEVATERKPEGELRAIQCAKYVLPMFVPDDFSDKVDLWFHSEDEDSYIQQFFIINTDWSLRSRIVANCIHASVVRAMNA